MLISHSDEFVFIAVHKTGSTTIRKSLVEYADITGNPSKYSPFFWHVTAPVLKKKFDDERWNWNSYFSFAFVRNPWERLVSAYAYRHKMVARWTTTAPKGKFLQSVFASFKNELKLSKDFAEWVNKFVVNGDYGVAMPQHKYLANSDGKSLVSFVGKLENMQSDFDFICDSIRVPRTKLDVVNKSTHKNYVEYYDVNTKKLVDEFYKHDISMFKYKFGN